YYHLGQQRRETNPSEDGGIEIAVRIGIVHPASKLRTGTGGNRAVQLLPQRTSLATQPLQPGCSKNGLYCAYHQCAHPHGLTREVPSWRPIGRQLGRQLFPREIIRYVKKTG